VDYSIVCDNCWGWGIYEKLQKQYNSPFVAVFIETPDYLKLLKNFDYYINKEIEVISDSKIFLGDIAILIAHPHQKATQEQIKETWNRRRDRLQAKILFKMGDLYNIKGEKIIHDNFGDMIKEFHELCLPYKISFTYKKYEYKNNFQIMEQHAFDARKLGHDYNLYFNMENILNETSI